MTNSEDATMAEASNPKSRFKFVHHGKKAKKLKETIATEGETKLTVKYPMRILMNADGHGTKSAYKSTYNLIPKVKTLMLTMAALDPGLTVTALDSKSTLLIGNSNFPATKAKFKQYFMCEWETPGKNQKEQIRLGCQISRNRTLNHMKHTVKPNQLLTWLNKEKVYLEADTLGIGKTKMIGYMTHVHPRLTNWTTIKTKIYDILEMTHISHDDATKLVNTTKSADNKNNSSEEPTIHCPMFEIFQTTIGIGPANARIETDVLGIKCQTGKAALLREFFLLTSDQLELKGHGKFVPAGLANVIGKDTMTNMIQDNNQYLKNKISIPINGMSKQALMIEILIDKENKDAENNCMTVYDYMLSTEWCQGLEPTDHEGRYLLITTHQELSEAREWLDDNLEEMFVKHIPQFGTFTPIEGYDFLKQGDKP